MKFTVIRGKQLPYRHKHDNTPYQASVNKPEGAQVLFCSRWYKLGSHDLIFVWSDIYEGWFKANDADGKIREAIERKYG